MQKAEVDMKAKSEVNAKLIAQKAGVSPSTVSMVLNNKGSEFRIAEKTVEKILQAANELGYQHVARVKRKKKDLSPGIICAFCPANFEKGPTIQFFGYFQSYIKEQHLPYEVILFPYETAKLREKAPFISSDFVAGAVMLALGEEDIDFLENNRFDIPILLVNRIANGYCSVLTDDYAVGSNSMSHFIKRGHRKFGILSPNYSSRALSLRTVGYWDKYQSSSFRLGEAVAIPTVFDEDGDLGGYNAMKKMLQSPTLPTAIFLPSDNMVSGVLRCIHENGYRVPQDIELISYGNKDINTIVEPGVTSFAPPLQEMSINSAKILHNAIANAISPDSIRMSFTAECIYRDSCPAS